MSDKHPVTYAETGVDIERGDAFVDKIVPLAQKTRRQGSMDALGGFGGMFDIKALGMKDPLLVAGTDGVGSKLDIALELGQFDTIGIDLVAMCVNDILCQNAEPLFFLDYLAVNRLEPEMGAKLVKGIVDGCLQSGCQLIGGETAEMPTLYPAGKFDLAGFAVGAVERDDIMPRADQMKAGNRVFGVASAGLHSNGYSLIQAVLKKAKLTLDQDLPGTGHNIGALMLEPTRIYVRSGLKAAPYIHGFAHITGGGIAGNLKRILPKGIGFDLDMNLVPAPDLCNWAVKSGWVAAEEAYRVWNMGIGLIAILEDDAEKIGQFGKTFGEAGFGVYDLGHLTSDGQETLRDAKFDLS